MSERLSDYDYSFPDELIAQAPLADRADSRMLVLPRFEGAWSHRRFRELPEFLRPGDLLVANDTEVLPSRLFARKPTGGRVEVFLLRALDRAEWSVLFSPARGLEQGMGLQVFCRETGEDSDVPLRVSSLARDDFRVAFPSERDAVRLIQRFGETPLPPYIQRPVPRSEDRERYQTIFARNPGAVAAPTAGLHFTPALREEIQAKGVAWALVTLHVGAGTFLPVKNEQVTEHVMHREFYEIPDATAQALRLSRERGGRVFAVGTTSLRALETQAQTGQPRGWTQLFVRPGFHFRAVDGLLTNFHQPKSTLLMLVSALAGRERMLAAYRDAIRERYRLFSYGDCMLISP